MANGYQAQHARNRRRRKAGLAAAAGTLLLVPAVTAGDTIALAAQQQPAPQAPRPVVPTDPSTVGADGSLPASSQVGTELLANADKPLDLAGAGPRIDLPNGPLGIPGAALQAYMRAAELMKTAAPDCHISWPLLASIGRIESGHARGGQVDAKGNTLSPILGPVLNGGGFAAIADTDGGLYDGDTTWDRAVGPMQFIPSTWAGYASDGNGDGVTSPSNVFDATLGAAKYLCSGGLDLSDPAQQAVAVFRYNNSDTYVRTVLLWADAYAKGVKPLPMTPVPPDVVKNAMEPVPGGSAGSAGSGSASTHPSTSSKPSKPTTTTIPGPSSTTSTPPSSSTTTTPPTSCTTTTTPTTTSSSTAAESSTESTVTASSTTNSADSSSNTSSTDAASDSSSSTTTSTTPTTPPPSC